MGTARGRLWTRDEYILAFHLYCQIPFGTIHIRNPRIIELANLLNRSASSVSLKLANLARLDPSLQLRGIGGMKHGAKADEEIWNEFRENPEALAFESEQAFAKLVGKPIEAFAEIATTDLPPEGLEREALVRLRVNQSFFRRRITSVYESRCCVTGMTFAKLLVASHIVPWAEDSANRLNPRNGLCLNALHDRAFDRHLMWVDEQFRVHFAEILHRQRSKHDAALDWLVSYEDKPLQLPKHFSPDPEFLRRHAAECVA